MERLNYFNPYESKSAHHEDRLTHAYMTLMRFSPSVAHVFYSYCFDVYLAVKGPDDEAMPSLCELVQTNWSYGTQKTNPTIDTDYLVSVLITDEGFTAQTAISNTERTARYDGLVVYGDKLCAIIEVKPRTHHVYEAQLAPSGINLNTETKIFPKPVVLEWKNIIKHLNGLIENNPLAAQENMMIRDFLDFVDSEFTFLNPYDKFSLCKGHELLLRRRIGNVLRAIAKDPLNVGYHRGWGSIIKIPFWEIYQIGLILKFDATKENWWLELSMFYGDTVSQARALYGKNIDLACLNDKDWDVWGNPHVSFRSQNLVWFNCHDKQKFIEQWKTNPEEIRQYKREEIESQLVRWNELGLLNYDTRAKEEMTKSFFQTRMSTINFCPGLGLIYRIEGSNAIQLDDEAKLVDLVRDKIVEGFGIIRLGKNDLKDLLKFDS